MLDNVKIPGRVGSARGYARVEYADEVSGKTKERIEGENHVFPDSFKCGFWSSVLSGISRDSWGAAARDNFFVTSDNAYPEDGFPYLRGNIVGFGRPRAGTPAHPLQGVFVGGESSPYGDPIEGGLGVRYRYTYRFSSAQLLEGIGSFGITTQYNPHAGFGTLMPIRERYVVARATAPMSTLNTPNVFRGHSNLRLHQTGIAATAAVTVMKQDLLTGNHGNLNVTPHFTALGAEQQRAVGLSFDSGRAYLMMLSHTATQRRLIEFEDQSFANVTGTYPLPTATQQGALRVFAVLGKTVFAYHPTTGQMMYIGDFTNPTNWITAPVPDCPYNTQLNLNPAIRSITIHEGILYSFGGGRNHFFDAGTKRSVANVFAGDFGLGRNTLGSIREPSLANPMFIHSFPWSPGEHFGFFANQALCCYAVPDGAPTRPAGTGVKITHQLEIMF